MNILFKINALAMILIYLKISMAMSVNQLLCELKQFFVNSFINLS